jgi:hypothetical protein
MAAIDTWAVQAALRTRLSGLPGGLPPIEWEGRPFTKPEDGSLFLRERFGPTGENQIANKRTEGRGIYMVQCVMARDRGVKDLRMMADRVKLHFTNPNGGSLGLAGFVWIWRAESGAVHDDGEWHTLNSTAYWRAYA